MWKGTDRAGGLGLPIALASVAFAALVAALLVSLAQLDTARERVAELEALPPVVETVTVEVVKTIEVPVSPADLVWRCLPVDLMVATSGATLAQMVGASALICGYELGWSGFNSIVYEGEYYKGTAIVDFKPIGATPEEVQAALSAPYEEAE